MIVKYTVDKLLLHCTDGIIVAQINHSGVPGGCTAPEQAILKTKIIKKE